jgi:hypothetical protein
MNTNVQISGHTGAALGVVVETGTDAITGKFYAVQVLADAQFSVFTENAKTGDVMTGFTIPAGTILYNGLGITAFTLSSGAVRAYKMQ